MDWLQDFVAEYQEDVTGPAVTDALCTIVDKILVTQLSEERIKTLLAAQRRPSSVNMLTNPRVNHHIWAKLKENTRKNDYKLVQVGEKIAKLMIATTSVLQKLRFEEPSTK